MNLITQNYEGGGVRFRALIENGRVNDVNGEAGMIFFFRNGRKWIEAHFQAGLLATPAGGHAIVEYNEAGDVVSAGKTARSLVAF